YKYSCSSIFVDAIAHKKPIICFSGPMSDYFFNTYGNIGFLCNDFDEMKNIIQRIIKLEYNATYSVQKNNIISASHDITNINRLLIQAKKNFPWL
ncbi:MAG: hypothetical protein KIH89_002580, partial [Candidatus Shapirobacteria bacterium]|nr:hypothetical protein [Candidatus Shapirobacteria bacterium]